MLFFQGSRFVLDEPVLVKGVGDELGVEGDVREAIAVLDSADHSRSLRQSPVGIGPVAILPLGLGLDGGRHGDETIAVRLDSAEPQKDKVKRADFGGHEIPRSARVGAPVRGVSPVG